MSDLDRESGKAADMDPDEEHSSELDERPQPEDFAPLTLLGLWFARGEDCDLVYREGVILMSEDELLRRRDAMAAQLKSRCAGLIESDDSWKKGSFRSIDPSGRIRYLHRTVRDFSTRTSLGICFCLIRRRQTSILTQHILPHASFNSGA
jgi:hypothetical protein